MKKVEILAPVGNYEMLETAIANNADAVYLGLENFNARAKADNFNSDNIRETVKLCHLYGIKVYITVNTLIADTEMDSVIQMIEKAHMANVDAFIIQDIGLVSMLKQKYPNIELHASTQMGVCNEYGAKVLEKLGFSRVVVARETTLEDIRRIKKETNLEIEAFIQGALCVCYSGSCYISSVLKNKSGNRGECLQLCRLPYKLLENGIIKKEGYLLSTRDISQLERLRELIDAGVCSFKIEGRLRRPAYLAQSLISVRNVLENKTSIIDEDYKLKKVFSRGEYNKGIYLTTKSQGGIINNEVNNHLGVEIGKVLSVNKFKDIFKILIETKKQINVGDGLKFIHKLSQQSMGVGSLKKLKNNQYEIFGKANPKVNSKVYLTVDSKEEQNLLNKTKSLPIEVEIIANANEKLIVTAKYKETEVQFLGEELQKAQNKPLTVKDFEDCFSKTGNTRFSINCISVQTNGIFIAKSVLNAVRRDVLKCLEDKIINNYENKHIKKFIKNTHINKNINHFNSSSINYYIVEDINKLKNVKDKDFNVIYAPSEYKIPVILDAIKYIKERYNKKPYIYLPVVANFRDLDVINKILANFPPNEIGIAAGSLYGIYYADKYDVIAMQNNNVANNYTADVLLSRGVKNFVSSIETNLFDNINSGYKYIGAPPLMTLVMCPFIENCKSECGKCIYNSKYTLVMDDGTELKIRRSKLSDCYFDLYFNKKITIPSGNGYVIDLRD